MLSAINATSNTAGVSATRGRPVSAKDSFDQAFRQANGADDLADALAGFRKEASLTPAQRARRDVLKSMDLTEDSLKAMSPDQRRATEQKIAAAVAHRLKLEQERKTGIVGLG